MTEAQEKLFWAKVNKSDSCWVWTASVGWNGYGMFGKPTRRAHLVALELAGICVPKGYLGLHKCNNPRCVRVHPDHVYVGTASQNMSDARENGWNPPPPPWVPGSLNGEAKLTEKQVGEIRATYQKGLVGRARRSSVSIQSLADQYDVHYSTIRRIIRRWSWRHV